MLDRKAFKRLLIPLGTGLVVSLSGCNLTVLDPKGSVGVAEKSLIATATGAMLLVVVPVILLTLLFAWRYRASNRSATYAPKWSHSTAIEFVVWTIPTLIILFLGILTWKTSHELDPYKPLQSEVKPINVDVVALDWKWLFIYPDLGIATVNQLAVPVGTPINFRITSDSVMNSFFIPQLGTQVYAMAGMQTRLHLIADEAGDYAGLSSNYSGRGFSDMKFRTLAKSPEEFNAWVEKVKATPQQLGMDQYATVAQPSEKAPVQYFSTVDPKLFHNIIAKYNNGHVTDFRDAACGTKG
ncbi:ubiquinol oxidase subunit II [Paraburkholderia caballeronis]|uniref:Ubiquinol oxidase subunit 2 n=1 Tax=Paraburkholderia caballeronis TaxID=416943 RepID=A0A1H7QJV2_9BURK|nr:ubiquinol oxidase subunit II [Paraburkholderia caballeronis]PXW22507.1 cytochrome bo3 quinol oxidase subunit 2 [Paraburkholderia caballeronis]PXW96378.1 cytochrome bo3 quinol oxidase subunit 2 [Paraburkholderia caballeronis]RAJ92789.1 cytochrome bo3 quinol oxidase subunit 2 [Paraburkholderia caballeronis]TDV15051.1 cytochrome bo3 quinol oxidase subunit 2 [Paraburkholderia caballeronis]TDV16824.1 cytochrome bo3 quinol oxidase subunit 2 [Paraburkholderia caballeronis]